MRYVLKLTFLFSILFFVGVAVSLLSTCKHLKDQDDSAVSEVKGTVPFPWNFKEPSVVLSCDQGALKVFADVRPKQSNVTPYFAKINHADIEKYVKFQKIEDLRLIPDIENTELVGDKDAFSEQGSVYYLKREGPGLRLERWRTQPVSGGTYSLKDKISHWYFQSCSWTGDVAWNFKGQNTLVNCKGASIKLQLMDIKTVAENRDPYIISIADISNAKKLQTPHYEGHEVGELSGLRFVKEAKEIEFIRDQDAFSADGRLYSVKRQGTGLVVELFKTTTSEKNGAYTQQQKLADVMFQNCL